MKNESESNKAEITFLTLAFSRFINIYMEIMSNSFWDENKYYRFSKIKDGFMIYTELLNYSLIKDVIQHIKENRHPMEAEIIKELFKTIRNILIHFPFFENWNEVWIDKSLVNWLKKV